MKAAVELILPLLSQAAGADDETALEITTGDQLLDQQASHDRLASAGIIGEQEAQGLACEHRLVDRRDLMGQRLDQRGMHRQHRVEEVGEVDAVRLGDQAEEVASAIETPGAPGADQF